MKKIFALLILPLMFSFNISLALAKSVIPGGESIGIVMSYPGVVITGTYDAPLCDEPKHFESGDLILEAEGKAVHSNEDLIQIIKDNLPDQTAITLKIQRGTQQLEETLSIYYDASEDSFKTGLYIKDSLTGIGTITFYDPEHQSFGALGHPLKDSDLSTSTFLEVTSGEAFDAYILSVEKSRDGSPGQKMARIEKTKHLGDVLVNDEFGIYGFYDTLYKADTTPMEVAMQNEVQLGEATILTSIQGHDVESYQIEITALENQKQGAVKGITFQVVDDELLKATNGVIQG